MTPRRADREPLSRLGPVTATAAGLFLSILAANQRCSVGRRASGSRERFPRNRFSRGVLVWGSMDGESRSMSTVRDSIRPAGPHPSASIAGVTAILTRSEVRHLQSSPTPIEGCVHKDESNNPLLMSSRSALWRSLSRDDV